MTDLSRPFDTHAPIGLVGLREQYDTIKPEIDAVLASVIARSAFIGGPELADFERWFAGYCGVRHALGVASGTSALELTFRALGVGRDDEIIAPAHTFVATASAISIAGARPVFVDVDERTFNMDPAKLEAAIGPKTKAIVAVHLYGRPAAMRDIIEIAARHGVPVIEDAAQAHGACCHGDRVGSLGIAGCFSFYPTKNLGAFGDGGLVTTNDDALAERIALLRDHGRVGKYEHAIIGYTARLDNLQAAVLRVKAKYLDEWNARRQHVAALYREALPRGLDVQQEDPDAASVYHLFVVRVRRRDAFRAFLEERGIATAIHYPIPLHLQPAYRHLGYSVGDFPTAERLAEDIVSLPMHPFLDRSHIDYIAMVATEFLRSA
jgi:dTDP-4-amino-4,6-dideoxygalactose transaminase